MIIFINHPLRIGVLLILQTIIVALSTGIIAGYFLISYIITIIILRGALVLFIYIASVASNELFHTPIKLIIIFLLLNLILPFLINKYENIENEITNLIRNINIETLITIKIYSRPSAYITIIIIIYLLFTIIVVSNNVNVNEGPLRIKIYE